MCGVITVIILTLNWRIDRSEKTRKKAIELPKTHSETNSVLETIGKNPSYRGFDRSDLWLVVKPLEDQIDFQ